MLSIFTQPSARLQDHESVERGDFTVVVYVCIPIISAACREVKHNHGICGRDHAIAVHISAGILRVVCGDITPIGYERTIRDEIEFVAIFIVFSAYAIGIDVEPDCIIAFGSQKA